LSIATTKHRTATRRQAVPKSGRKSGQPIEKTGLCVTCVRRAECAYPRNTDQPVVFCEEFDSQLPADVAEETQPEAAVITEEQMKVWDEYKGLCVNCDSRENCAIRNAEIGVWHCEEYS
jgi:hypothetical protein